MPTPRRVNHDMATQILPVAAQNTLIMEEDDDFYARDLAEAERQGQQPSADEDDLYDFPKAAVPFVASWKENAQPARSAMQAMEELVTRRPGVKEGKQKMPVEEEEIAFGEEDYGEGFGEQRGLSLEEARLAEREASQENHSNLLQRSELVKQIIRLPTPIFPPSISIFGQDLSPLHPSLPPPSMVAVWYSLGGRGSKDSQTAPPKS